MLKKFSIVTYSMLAMISHSYAQTIFTSEVAPYEDLETIDPLVINECTNLGQEVTNQVIKFSKEKEIDIQTTIEPLEEQELALQLSIIYASSGGIGYINHLKFLTIRVQILKNGREIASKNMQSKSKGGLLGQFKSSCSVLDINATKLGKDVSLWLQKEIKPQLNTIPTNESEINY